MNRWQAVQQVRYLLEQATWPEGAGVKILPVAKRDTSSTWSAIVSSSSFDAGLLGKLRPPFVFIGPAGGTPDPEHPELLMQRFSIALFVQHFGDPYGEAVLLGNLRDTAAGTSVRRGLLEIMPALIASIVGKGREAGLAMRVSGLSEQAPVPARPGIHDAFLVEEHTIEMPICDQATGEYPPAKYLAGSVSGSNVTVTWTAAPPRWDATGQLALLLRKSGSAPTSAEDTDATSVSTVATSPYTDTPGTGTWYYAVAMEYDEGQTTRYSDLVTAGSYAV